MTLLSFSTSSLPAYFGDSILGPRPSLTFVLSLSSPHHLNASTPTLLTASPLVSLCVLTSCLTSGAWRPLLYVQFQPVFRVFAVSSFGLSLCMRVLRTLGNHEFPDRLSSAPKFAPTFAYVLQSWHRLTDLGASHLLSSFLRSQTCCPVEHSVMMEMF